MRTYCPSFLAPLLILAFATAGEAAAATYSMSVAPVRADARYRQGEEVSFQIMVLRGGRPFVGQQVSYVIREEDGTQVEAGSAALTARPLVVKAKVEGPAIVTCEASYSTGTISDSESASAVVAPELFKPAQPPPEDFDAFWQAQRQLLASAPAQPTMQPASLPEGADPALKLVFNTVEILEVEVPTINGMPPLRGHLARPKGAAPQSLPAILYPQSPGPRMVSVQPSRQEMMRAARERRAPAGARKGDAGPAATAARSGMLALSFPFDDLTATQGAGDSRENHFLRGVMLRQMRALDLLAQQPEWNGRILIVQGEGIGGGLALAAAGLDPRVTLCVAGVPTTSYAAAIGPRRPARPGAAPDPPATEQPTDEQAKEAQRYFDPANFATCVQVQTNMTIDYSSTAVAPPAGVLAAFNAIPAGVKKELIRVDANNREKVQPQLNGIVRRHVNAPAVDRSGAAPGQNGQTPAPR